MKNEIQVRVVNLENGELRYYPRFLTEEAASSLFNFLQESTPWRSDKIKIFGKEHLVPRLQAWYGDEGAEYSYSGIRLKPLPWSPKLMELRKDIEILSGHTFNSVLLNLYRDGKDSNGWHSDDEKELGKNPVIASVTLGQSRPFKLKHKSLPLKESINLEHGSLLLMIGSTQHYWKHQIPKSAKKLKPRINLTFRRIFP